MTGYDAEIQAQEDLFLGALGQPKDSGRSTPEALGEPSPEFRDRLKAQFVGSDVALDRLREWSPGAPRAEFRDELRGAFLDVDQAASAHQAGSQRTGTRQQPRTRRSPAPLPSGSKRFRLAALGGVFAAAAAALLFFQRPTSDVAPATPQETEVAAVLPKAAELQVEQSAWRLDTDLVDAATLLASIRIDGETVASMDDFRSQIATAERIQTISSDLRIQHDDEFVLELGAGTTVRLDRWSSQATDSESRVLFAEVGSVRVATGPGFDSEAGLVVETPHVRTKVVGTIFGLDIGENYTCICCVEGAVEAQMFGQEPDEFGVPAGMTWVADMTKPSPWRGPLAVDHRGPLDRLVGYWA